MELIIAGLTDGIQLELMMAGVGGNVYKGLTTDITPRVKKAILNTN